MNSNLIVFGQTVQGMKIMFARESIDRIKDEMKK